MNLDLNGKIVFVSASSQGIGKAVAEAFLEEGAMVIINGREIGKLEKARAYLEERYGSGRVYHFSGDMTGNDCALAAAYIKSKFGRLDKLVCNLGSGKGSGEDRFNVDEWKRLFDINLFSSVRLADEFKSLLLRSGDPSIVMLSSIASVDKIGAPPAYAGAKAGINVLVKYMADEWALDGIRVNGVAPGNVLFEGGRWEELCDADPEGTEKYITTCVPMKRFGKVSEIGDVVVFVSSERASFMTGEVIRVDGGQSRSI